MKVSGRKTVSRLPGAFKKNFEKNGFLSSKGPPRLTGCSARLSTKRVLAAEYVYNPATGEWTDVNCRHDKPGTSELEAEEG